MQNDFQKCVKTLGTRTTSGSRGSSRWYVSNFHFHKNLDSQLSNLRIGLCFSIKTFSCSLLFLLHRNVMISMRC